MNRGSDTDGDPVGDAPPQPTRQWGRIAAMAVALGVAAGAGALAYPGMVHGNVVAGTLTANPAEVAAAAAERKAAADAADLAQLQIEVRQSMQDYYSAPEQVESLRAQIQVFNVNLVKTGDNTYEGMATMSADGGPQRDIQVHVSADSVRLLWNTDAGALAPLFH